MKNHQLFFPYQNIGISLLLLMLLNIFSMEAQKTSLIHQNGINNQLKADANFLQLKQAYSSAIERKAPLEAAGYLQGMGELCLRYGHYPQALEFQLQANNMFRTHKKKELLAGNLNDLGKIYYHNMQKNTARQYYDEGFKLYKSLNNKVGMAETLGNIGQLYEKQQKYDSAFYYQHQALVYYKKSRNSNGIAKIYENLGSIFEDLAQYDSAYYYYDFCLKINQQNNNTIAQIEVINNLGDILRKTGKYQAGLVFSKKALALALKENERYELAGAYRDMAKSYNLMAKNDSAFYYLELSRKLALDIYSEKSNQQVAILQVMFDMAKKNNEIENLNNARKTNQILGIAIVMVTLLLVALFVVIISRQKLKIKNERFLHQQQKHIHETQRELMQVELRNQLLEEQNLKSLLAIKTKELSTHTLHVIQKNQLLEKLYHKLEETVKDQQRDPKRQLRQIMQEINHSFNHDQYWEEFRGIFEQVHQTFFDKLKTIATNLTANDLRLVALLKMNLASADIASLLGISQDSLRVVRYRLRKKLNLAQGDSLTIFIQTL